MDFAERWRGGDESERDASDSDERVERESLDSSERDAMRKRLMQEVRARRSVKRLGL